MSATFELVLTVIAVIELSVFGAVVLPDFSWGRQWLGFVTLVRQ